MVQWNSIYWYTRKSQRAILVGCTDIYAINDMHDNMKYAMRGNSLRDRIRTEKIRRLIKVIDIVWRLGKLKCPRVGHIAHRTDDRVVGKFWSGVRVPEGSTTWWKSQEPTGCEKQGTGRSSDTWGSPMSSSGRFSSNDVFEDNMVTIDRIKYHRSCMEGNIEVIEIASVTGMSLRDTSPEMQRANEGTRWVLVGARFSLLFHLGREELFDDDPG